ncbi:MAG: hypothetical protein Q9220_003824 [cf. Caloplaca sp. 1 TL-2023]
MAEAQKGQTPFGHAMRAHFQFDPSFVPLNHGSFGTYPKSVKDCLRAYQNLSEKQPDAFFRYDLAGHIDNARASIAQFLGVDVEECVFMPNATTGVNTVLRSLVFKEKDVIVYFSTIYGACEKTVQYIKETTPVDMAKIAVTYPIDDAKLIAAFRDKLKQLRKEGRNVKVALFDTVSSLPGVKVPWDNLVKICKDEGVLSLVDGAHGVGHIDLQLGKVQPDFFVSNLHKGCAIFYVPKRNQHLIRSSLPTSHGYEPFPQEGQQALFNPIPGKGGRFANMFAFVGTADVGPYLCVPEALKFRQEVCGGETKIMEYCKQISNEGGKRVAQILGTEVMENTEKTLTECCLTNVKLPLRLGTGGGKIKEADAFAAVGWMAETLIRKHNVFAPPYFHGGFFWVRLSGQTYVETEDFDIVAKALKGLCERVERGEHLQQSSKL